MEKSFKRYLSFLNSVFVSLCIVVIMLQVPTANAETAQQKKSTKATSFLKNNKNIKKTSTKKKTVEPFKFEYAPGPPPGFEHLDKEQTTYADVFYAGQPLGLFKIIYTPEKVRIDDPTAIVNRIQTLTNNSILDRDAVIKALTGEHTNNANYVCLKDRRTCGISPDVAGIVFDPNTFKAEIYINGKYLTRQPFLQYVPEPTNGFSYINELRGIASGSSGSESGSSNNFAFYSNNLFGQNNKHMRLQVSYQSQRDRGAGATVNEIDQFQVNEFSAGFHHKRYKFEAGLLENQGDFLIGNQQFLGVTLHTTTDTLRNREMFFGTPIELFLQSPSQVTVFSQGKLIGSGFYQAGNQRLDTSSFPQGSYPITIVIRSQTGATRTEQNFFVKSTQVPALGYPDYHLNVGYWAPRIAQTTTFPDISSTPYLEFGTSRRMAQSWGLSGNVIATNKRGYLIGGVFYIRPHFQIQPEALIGTDGDNGVGFISNYDMDRFSASLTARHLWADGDQILGDNEDFDPITIVRDLAYFNLSYSLSDVTSLRFNANYSKSADADAAYSYGPTLRHRLDWFDGTSYFQASVTNTNDGLLALVSFSFDFFRPTWSAGADIGYQTASNNEDANTGLVAGADATWRHWNSANEGTTLGVRANTSGGSNSVGGNAMFTGRYGEARFDVNHSDGNGSSGTTQYTGDAASSIVYAPNKVAIGGAKRIGAGIIVDVKADKPGEFEVIANNRAVKVVKANTATAISLQPFKTYEVKVKPVSEVFYSYDERPKYVTLYQNNYAKLDWEATEKLILFTKILLPDGKPMKNTLVSGGIGFNATDEEGYLQAEVYDDTKQLTGVLPNGDECVIKFPVKGKLEAKDGLVEFKDLTCLPMTAAEKEKLQKKVHGSNAAG